MTQQEDKHQASNTQILSVKALAIPLNNQIDYIRISNN